MPSKSARLTEKSFDDYNYKIEANVRNEIIKNIERKEDQIRRLKGSMTFFLGLQAVFLLVEIKERESQTAEA